MVIKEYKFNDLISNFIKYINIADKYRFGERSYIFYRTIIDIQKKDNNFLNTPRLSDLLYYTLKSWNIGQRASRLYNKERIKDVIDRNRKAFSELRNYKLYNIKDSHIANILNSLGKIFNDIKISNTKIVPNSKLMHFLLPNLVMPIDGKFTKSFFHMKNKETEVKYFIRIFDEFRNLCKTIISKYGYNKLSKYNFSFPKLIDNSIIRYYLSLKTNRYYPDSKCKLVEYSFIYNAKGNRTNEIYKLL